MDRVSLWPFLPTLSAMSLIPPHWTPKSLPMPVVPFLRGDMGLEAEPEPSLSPWGQGPESLDPPCPTSPWLPTPREAALRHGAVAMGIVY